jgi:hypothetical protein
LGLSVLGFIALLYAIIIDKGERTFLSTIGVVVLKKADESSINGGNIKKL